MTLKLGGTRRVDNSYEEIEYVQDEDYPGFDEAWFNEG